MAVRAFDAAAIRGNILTRTCKAALPYMLQLLSMCLSKQSSAIAWWDAEELLTFGPTADHTPP